MNRFLGEVAFFLALQLGVFGTLIGVFYRRDLNGYDAATIDKHALLQSQPAPRVVFVGGSNLSFGLDSTMVAEQLLCHPVNMGLFAGLSADYLLREVESDLRSGDTVVLVLEYEHYRPDWTSNALSLILQVEARPENARYLRWPQIKAILDQGLVAYAGGVVRRACASVLGRPPAEGGVYARGNFNELGDTTAHWDAPVIPQGESICQVPPDGLNQELLADLNVFYARCRRRDIAVYLACPPLPKFSFADLVGAGMGFCIVQRQGDPGLRETHRQLRSKVKIPLITEPNQLLMPVEFCYNSCYHLTREGTRWRTQLLIDRLRLWLGIQDAEPQPDMVGYHL